MHKLLASACVDGTVLHHTATNARQTEDSTETRSAAQTRIPKWAWLGALKDSANKRRLCFFLVCYAHAACRELYDGRFWSNERVFPPE